jgi:hypothetical protein
MRVSLSDIVSKVLSVCRYREGRGTGGKIFTGAELSLIGPDYSY